MCDKEGFLEVVKKGGVSLKEEGVTFKTKRLFLKTAN